MSLKDARIHALWAVLTLLLLPLLYEWIFEKEMPSEVEQGLRGLATHV